MRDGLGSVQSLLVLGGRSDIGLATARALVSARTRTVILAARKPESLKSEADELVRRGAERVGLANFDATDLESHADFVAGVFAEYGDIDVVLVAFGVLGDQQLLARDAEAAVSSIETNFVGAVSVLIPVVERMKSQGHGTIVVLSSVAAERPRKSNFVYGAAKAGLDAFAQGLGDSLAGSGVGMLVVRPGFVRTKMTQGRAAIPLSVGPDDVARAIAGGLRSGAHTVWVPAQLRWVMWALRQVPRPIFRRLEI